MSRKQDEQLADRAAAALRRAGYKEGRQEPSGPASPRGLTVERLAALLREAQ